jgi:hypothetical protein
MYINIDIINMASLDKLTSIINLQKRLKSYSIKNSSEIDSTVLLLERLTKVFYESNIKKMEKQELNNAVSGVIQDMWIIFWFEQLKIIEEYHKSIKSYWDESGYDRKQDVKIKFLQINEILLENWLHPFPPFDGLLLSESKLVRQMIYSDKYVHKCYIDDAIYKTEYGYVSSPKLKNTELLYDIRSYIDYRRENHDDIEWSNNELLLSLLSNNEDEKDVYNLVLNKYGSKTYKELYEKSCLKNFINFEPYPPNLEYNNSYEIRDLLNDEWVDSDKSEDSYDSFVYYLINMLYKLILKMCLNVYIFLLIIVHIFLSLKLYVLCVFFFFILYF